MRIHSKKYGIVAGLMLGAAGAWSAQAASSFLTFSVDMSVQIGNATFTPGVDTVAVRGSFNGWGTLNLVQQGASSIYTNSVEDTADANGGKLEYKFWNNHGGGDIWETPANNQNRAALLPATSGGSLTLPTAYFADAGPTTPNAATFQVDMAQQIAIGNFTQGSSTVEVQGNFQGWVTGATLVQQGSSTIYTNTFDLTGSPGSINNYKFVIVPGNYEDPSAVNKDGTGNRYVANVPGQTLAPVYFSDQPPAPVVTNYVLFQVDMNAQLLNGNLDPLTETVCVNGGFNSWSSGINYLTNNGAGIYTNTVKITGSLDSTVEYKFVIYDPVSTTTQWEDAIGNRSLTLLNVASQTLPPVYFNNQSPGELLPSATTVTFSVDMTGAVGTDAYHFNPATDFPYINGQFANWWAPDGWSIGDPSAPFPPPPAHYQMTRVGSSMIYTWTTNFPAGQPVMMTYKYSINGIDDEAPTGSNHIRYIRTLSNYTMPQDTWSVMTVEQSFGNLKAGPVSGGYQPITWLGRPGVHLQSSANLSSWTDVPGTDATSSNGVAVGPGYQFFRLIKP